MLVVMTPIGRESDSLEAFVQAVRLQLPNDSLHLLVMDSWTDAETRSIADALTASVPGTRVVDIGQSEGIAHVYVSGHKEALSMGATLVLEMDAGFSHSPEQIPGFLDAVAHADAALGSRRLPESRFYSTKKRRLISELGTRSTRLLCGSSLTDLTSGFQMFRAECLQEILEHGVDSTGPFFQTEMKVSAERLGFRLVEVPISYESPSHDVSVSQVIDAAKGLVRLARSKP